MNEQEIRNLIRDLRAQFKKAYKGKSEDDIDHMILDMFFKSYCDDKICREDLETLTIAMGYEPVKKVLDEIERQKKGGK